MDILPVFIELLPAYALFSLDNHDDLNHNPYS
jgi:hypothetical protein